MCIWHWQLIQVSILPMQITGFQFIFSCDLFHVKNIKLDTELVELLRGKKYSHFYTMNVSEESSVWNNGKTLSTFCRVLPEKNADIRIPVSFSPCYFASVFNNVSSFTEKGRYLNILWRPNMELSIQLAFLPHYSFSCHISWLSSLHLPCLRTSPPQLSQASNTQQSRQPPTCGAPVEDQHYHRTSWYWACSIAWLALGPANVHYDTFVTPTAGAAQVVWFQDWALTSK